jgi:hypothetical protein
MKSAKRSKDGFQMATNFHLLWGLPILKTKIDSNSFNKKEILDTIEQNYNKSNIRENWFTVGGGYFETNIHHSLCDDENKNFTKPDYHLLEKIYVEIIKNYLNNLGFYKKFNFDYKIINYTASRHESIMEPHLHIECEFSMIHYLQFENNTHSSTVFMNPYTFNDFWINKNKLSDKISPKNTNHSWVFGEWKYDIQEDDCIIFPSILKHFVRNKKTKKTRITIASNISIK